MTDFEQVAFGGVEFADNPEPRCPCVLILDTSGSMAGTKIEHLNEGLRVFEEELKGDAMAAKRVEVAIVTFGPVQDQLGFTTADGLSAPQLRPQGDTPMGAAIMKGIEMLNGRKAAYKANGIGYYRPWIFLITDGAPTDRVQASCAAIREGEASKSFASYAVGVECADMERLRQLNPARAPLGLRGLSFRELFVWLSNSLGGVSRSQMGEVVQLQNPTAPNGWAVAG